MDPEPVPVSLARGQKGPAQSPRAAGHAQPVGIPQSEPHSRGLSSATDAEARDRAREHRCTADLEGPGGTASSLGVRAALGHQVEAAPARQLGDRVRRQESCAGTHRTGRGARLGAAEQLALTWARVALARRGLPAGSPVLLLALPLAFAFFALRHLAEDERSTQTRVGDGDARQVWCKGLQKSLSPEGKASGRAARGRRLSSTGRGVDSITWSLRYVSGCLGDTLVSQVLPLPVLEWPRSGGLSRSLITRRGKGAHSPGLRSHLSAAAAAALRSAPAARAARSSHKFWGSPSRLFFNCPQVGRRRLLRTLPSPRPLPLPHHTPTPRRRHATGRSLS